MVRDEEGFEVRQLSVFAQAGRSTLAARAQQGVSSESPRMSLRLSMAPSMASTAKLCGLGRV